MEKVGSVTGLRPLEAPQDETAAGSVVPEAGAVEGWPTYRRKRDCDVCRGRGKVTLARWKPVLVTDLEITGFELDAGRSQADYPCPACTETISADQTAVIEADVQVHPEYLNDPRALEMATRAAAHKIVDVILDRGLIVTRTQKSPDPWNPATITATLGVMAPVAVATVEQRIAARQLEVAERVVREAKASIAVWGRDYGETHISKDQACDYMGAALRAVRSTFPSQEAPNHQRPLA